MRERHQGEISIVDPGSDKEHRTGTFQCCHCGRHHEDVAGTGKLLGYCFRCRGYFCGPSCEECVPQEAMIEIMEGTRNPTAVSAGGGYGRSLWVP